MENFYFTLYIFSSKSDTMIDPQAPSSSPPAFPGLRD